MPRYKLLHHQFIAGHYANYTCHYALIRCYLVFVVEPQQISETPDRRALSTCPSFSLRVRLSDFRVLQEIVGFI